MSAAKPAAVVPESTDTPAALKLLAARAHVLGCSPAVCRELTRLKKSEQDMSARVRALEAAVRMLTTLAFKKK